MTSSPDEEGKEPSVLEPTLAALGGQFLMSQLTSGTWQDLFGSLKEKVLPDFLNHPDKIRFRVLEKQFDSLKHQLPPDKIKAVEKLVQDCRQLVNSGGDSWRDATRLLDIIERNLSVHAKPLNIDTGKSLEEKLRVILDTYDGDIQKDLYDIVQAIVLNIENTKDKSRVPPILLQGAPGVGKTRVAKELAKALGIPIYIKRLAGLKGADVEGSSWMWDQNLRYGIIPDALEHAGTEKGCSNVILLLDEVDKAFKNEKRSDKYESWLLEVLDVEVKKMRSKILKTNLDLSKIIVIMTANKKFPPEFDALKSRMMIVEFPALVKSLKVTIGERYFEKLFTNFGLERTPADDAVLAQILERDEHPGARILKLVIKNYVNFRLAQPIFADWTYFKDQKYEVDATYKRFEELEKEAELDEEEEKDESKAKDSPGKRTEREAEPEDESDGQASKRLRKGDMVPLEAARVELVEEQTDDFEGQKLIFYFDKQKSVADTPENQPSDEPPMDTTPVIRLVTKYGVYPPK